MPFSMQNRSHFALTVLSLAIASYLPGTTTAQCNTALCQDALPRSSESLLALTLSGRPSDINPTDIDLLKSSIADSYSCDGDLRNVTKVLFRPDLSVDLTSSVNGTYSLVYEVDWITNICQDGFFQSSGTTRNRELLREAETISSKSQSTNSHITKRELQVCNCTVPTSDEFLLGIAGAYLGEVLVTPSNTNFSIDDFVTIEETEEIENCNKTRSAWSGSAAWTVNEDLSSVGDEYLQALGEAALEVFNSWAATCDESSRRVKKVEVNIRPVINANLQVEDDSGRRRERNLRWLQSQNITVPINMDVDIDSNSTNTTNATGTDTSESPSLSPTESPTDSPTSQGADLFTIVFSIQGSCFNCQSDLQLFDQVTGLNRRLVVHARNRRLDTSAVCVCPGGLPRRGQTAREFVSRLQDKVAEVPILAGLADKIGPFAEVRPIGCGLFNEFLSIARVDFATNGGGMVELDGNDKRLLEQGFVSTYNGLQGRRCDRFFRILESAEVVGTINGGADGMVDNTVDGFGRALQSNGAPIVNITVGSEELSGNETFEDLSDEPSLSPTLSPTSSPTSQGADLVTIVFLTTGSCAGCPSEFNLFNQLTSGRRLAEVSEVDTGMAGHPSLPDLSFTRRLEDDETADKCFCQLQEETEEPDAAEFVVEFSFLVEELSEEGAISSNITGALALTQTTGTPSSMPSIAPSLSSEPSANPSLSLEPSLIPSFSPSLNGTNVTVTPTNATVAPSLANATAIPSAMVSSAPSFGASLEPSGQTASPSDVPSDRASLGPSVFPSEFPSEFPSDFPSAFPSGFPSPLPTVSPTAVPSDLPSTLFPSGTPSVRSESPSKSPSSTPSDFPSTWFPSEPPSVRSESPSETPSFEPSLDPTVAPSGRPSESFAPTGDPTRSLRPTESASPSSSPSTDPSGLPSSTPSDIPSTEPSDLPSAMPSRAPSSIPSVEPSDVPSAMPSRAPTSSPSVEPSDAPTAIPSRAPSAIPSNVPSNTPTGVPSRSLVPSFEPSALPSTSPSTGVPSTTPSWPSTEPSSTPSASPSEECEPVAFIDVDNSDFQPFPTPSRLGSIFVPLGTAETTTDCIGSELSDTFLEETFRLEIDFAETVKISSCGSSPGDPATGGPRATILQIFERPRDTCTVDCVVSSDLCEGSAPFNRRFATQATLLLDPTEEPVVVKSYRVPIPYFSCAFQVNDATGVFSSASALLVNTATGPIVLGNAGCIDNSRLVDPGTRIKYLDVDDTQRFLKVSCTVDVEVFIVYSATTSCEDLLPAATNCELFICESEIGDQSLELPANVEQLSVFFLPDTS